MVSFSVSSVVSVVEKSAVLRGVRGLKPTLRVLGSPRHKAQSNYGAIFRVVRVFRG